MILLGKRIKELRNKYRLTQTELANQVGVTKSTIAAYENDSRLPSYDVLIKMADVFKITIDSLLLNRSETILDAHDLNVEQIEILNIMIAYFRKNNMLEDFFANNSPELKELVKDYLEKRIGVENRME